VLVVSHLSTVQTLVVRFYVVCQSMVVATVRRATTHRSDTVI